MNKIWDKLYKEDIRENEKLGLPPLQKDDSILEGNQLAEKWRREKITELTTLVKFDLLDNVIVSPKYFLNWVKSQTEVSYWIQSEGQFWSAKEDYISNLIEALMAKKLNRSIGYSILPHLVRYLEANDPEVLVSMIAYGKSQREKQPEQTNTK